jgi:hypothetical protein
MTNTLNDEKQKLGRFRNCSVWDKKLHEYTITQICGKNDPSHKNYMKIAHLV